jgi:16S rRNA (adenine1518-N6/adenine1519-N6)-dimethyltransferase
MRIQPKKRLGQNFLLDKNIQRKILDSLELKKTDIVLEIGAGTGELTRQVCEKAHKVFALEIDETLCALLKERTAAYGNASVIHADFLRFDLNKFFKKFRRKVKVLGNIPYYITTPILERLLKSSPSIEVIFLTVQKEFAERIAASAGGKVYGSLSCFAQYHAAPRILFAIKRNSFYPAPKVDSCFLRLDMRSAPLLSPSQEKKLFKIIRSSFNQRRKTLRNSLEGVVPQEALQRFFEVSCLDRNVRPETLTLEHFCVLSKIS